MTLDSRWLDDLNTYQPGRIWWLNLQYDLEASNLPSTVVEVLYDKINRSLRDKTLQAVDDLSPDPLAPSRYLRLLESLIRENPRAFDLRSRRAPRNKIPLSRIIDLTCFALFNVNLAGLGLEMDEGTPDAVWDLLGTIVTNEHYTGYMKTERDFFWCTYKYRLKLMESVSEDVATNVRDVLGLHNVHKGQKLLRIDVPPRSLVGVRVCAPTTLDAGSNIAFCPSNDSNGVGWTIDLRSLRNGLEEVVVGQLPFTSDFEVIKLGSVNSECRRLDLDILERRSVKNLEENRKRTG